MSRRAIFGLLTLCLFAAMPARAAIVEDVVSVPVTAKDIYGRAYSQDITVSIFRDDARARSPFLVLSHGRPASNADNLRMGRQRYTAISRYFVSKGFVVLVPTRMGYGVSGGADVEYSGNDCRNRQFAGAIAAAADQIAATISFAKSLPYVDAARGMAAGQSAGGIATIALAARNIPGVLAAANFAGGNGGRPDVDPDHPCSPERIKDLYREWGAQTKIPTLWLYSENDHYWGPQWPHDWFDAFAAGGNKARFVQLPPYKQNGHGIFSGEPEAWKPAFEAFIDQSGF